MMSSDTRILKVYYNSSQQADYTISVDGLLKDRSKNNFDSPQYYFEFVTPVTLHGSSTVHINVTKGYVTLVRCTATYPALINGKNGKVTMQQPIHQPVGIIVDNTLQTKKFPITITDELSYQHIMFNGPTLFKVKSKQYYNNLYLGDVLDGQTHPDVEKIETVYDYTPESNDIFSKSDLQYLHDKVKSNFVSQ